MGAMRAGPAPVVRAATIGFAVVGLLVPCVVSCSSTGNRAHESIPGSSATTAVTTTGWGGYIHEVLDVVEANAYFADRVDFDAWRQRITQVTAGPLSYYDMVQLVGQILVDLSDHHSKRLSPGEYRQLNATMDDSTLHTPAPTGTIDAADGVGLLTVPSIIAGAGSGAYDSYVTAAHQLLQQPACGWIVDLRGNTGGSIPPMMAAVAPLIGSGTFLGYHNRDGTIFGYQTTDTAVTTVADTHLDRRPQRAPTHF